MKPKDFPIGTAVYYVRAAQYRQSDTFPGTVVGHTDKKVKITYNGWDVQGREGNKIPAAVSPDALQRQ